MRVQSSHKDADFLEYRINNFLNERVDWAPSSEDLQKQNDSMVNELMQKPTNLYAEAGRHWTQICNEDYDFDVRK